MRKPIRRKSPDKPIRKAPVRVIPQNPLPTMSSITEPVVPCTFKFDRKVFFAEHRKIFGALSDDQVSGINFLLDNIESDKRYSKITNKIVERNKLAYCLATFRWETASTMLPIKEYGGATYHNKRYGPHTRVGRGLGNIYVGDGAKYCGRGYVQLTGRANYAKASKLLGVDLLSFPERVCEPSFAYQIAMSGMYDGWFTGKSLGNYFAPGIAKWTDARRIINGTDKALKIGNIAKQYDIILRLSLI